jgi:hypothetical protein
METFRKLFGSLLTFVYHCFDRIVIQGYLPLLTRPERIVHFFRDVHGIYPITKQALAARHHRIPLQWPEKDSKRKASRRKTTSDPTASAWNAASASGSTSFSKAWNRAPPSVRCRRSFPRRTPLTASSKGTGLATPITTSTFATKCARPHGPVRRFLPPLPDPLLDQRSSLHRR